MGKVVEGSRVGAGDSIIKIDGSAAISADICRIERETLASIGIQEQVFVLQYGCKAIGRIPKLTRVIVQDRQTDRPGAQRIPDIQTPNVSDGTCWMRQPSTSSTETYSH